MTKINYCRNCGYLLSKGVCQLNGQRVNPNEDFCSKHQEIFVVADCAVCGKPICNVNLLLDVQEDGSVRYIHLECGKALGTCRTCANVATCEFETNPDPMPKVVMQTVRQGNMVMQTQVKNPSRIEKFCHNCQCFNPDFGCFKENGCCDGKWKEK